MRITRQFITTIVLSVMLITSGLFAFASGDGTSTDPWQITTAADLNSVRNYMGSTYTDTHFTMMNDIDLTAYLASGGAGYIAWGAEGWLPFGGSGNPFCGHFDGGNHKISGLKIDRWGVYECAFWSYTQTSSIIENLNIETAADGYVFGYRRNGMLAGTNLGTINNCSVSGTVKGGLWSGMLVGWNDGTINRCYSNGSMIGTDNAIGGLVGQNNATISNSYSRASAQGVHYIGGLVGFHNAGTITNCYATGLLTGGQRGGLCGAAGVTVTNSYWDKQTTGLTTSYGSESYYGLLSSQMKNQSSYTGWDFMRETVNGTNDYWGINPFENGGYPFLKWQGYKYWLPVGYVTQSGAGLKDGSSWADAYDNTQLQTAINDRPYQVWVEAGTYKPTTTSDRTVSFILKNGVAVYGGFSGTETGLEKRNIGLNQTILSGDIGTAGVSTDNSYHLLYSYQDGLNNSAVIDGFTIKSGRADGASPHDFGGGISLYLSSPSIINCTITDNYASLAGGGIDLSESYPQIVNCLITNNTGGGIEAAGYYPYQTITLTNCTIANNVSGSYFIRGGIWARYINLVLNNCIIWGNSASYRKQIFIMEGSCTLNYSCYSNGTGDIEVSTDGIFTVTNNNITTNPLFVNTALKDYRLLSSSPCLDTGNDAYNSFATDIRSINRKLNKTDGTIGTIDIGPFEYQYIPLVTPQNVTTVKNGTNLDLSWTAVTGAAGYKVYSSTDPYGTFTEAATVTTNSWSVLVSATKYFYYVKAYN